MTQEIDPKLEMERARLSAISVTLSQPAFIIRDTHGADIEKALNALHKLEEEYGEGWYYDIDSILDTILDPEVTVEDEDWEQAVAELTTAFDKLLIHGLVYVEHLEDEPHYRTTRDARAYFNYSKVK